MISEDYNKRMSGYYTQELSLCLQTILLLFELQSKTDIVIQNVIFLFLISQLVDRGL